MVKIVFDGFGLILLGIIILTWIIFGVASEWKNVTYHLFKAKAWAKVYTNYPDMLLDRKYGIKYKKHWWNKYKIYNDGNRNSTNYLRYEAEKIVSKIENGEIKI